MVSNFLFTKIPLSVAIPEPSKKLILGLTPVQIPTTSQEISSPESVRTALTFPLLSPSILSRLVSGFKEMPCERMCSEICFASFSGKTLFQLPF